MKNSIRIIFATFISTVMLIGFVGQASAGPMTCPDIADTPDRQATLDSADDCMYGLGNAGAPEVAGHYGGTWVEKGGFAGANGTSGPLIGPLFSVDVTGGTWGAIPANGTWAIDSSFWATYAKGVITMHIGNGGGDPDHWAWLVTPDSLSGTWSVAKLSGSGGGLSNIKLWGGDPCVPGTPGCGDDSQFPVPEPGVLSLLGMGLLGLGLSRRRLKLKA